MQLHRVPNPVSVMSNVDYPQRHPYVDYLTTMTNIQRLLINCWYYVINIDGMIVDGLQTPMMK